MTVANGTTALDGIGARIMRHADLLARHTEVPGQLTRTFLTPVQRAAADTLMEWMREAGMSARLDAIGNVVGRYEGEHPGRPALMLGSHFDSVRNAGRYDGDLGVIAPIACVDALHRAGRRQPFAIEVVAFADEEGVRFQATLLGSRAVAGTFDPGLLARRDADGVSMSEALVAYGLDPAQVAGAARRRDEILAYCELHIEQGPVLLTEGLPVGVVTSIVGFNRFMVRATGLAGHAGTVPMALRRDAAAAAADIVLFVERRCRSVDGLVGTVGQLNVPQGATNVIPGACEFSLDVRSGDDAVREAAVADILAGIDAVGARRGVAFAVTPQPDCHALRLRAVADGPARRRRRARRRAGPATAFRRRPRRDGDRSARRRRDAVRPLRQRRHQPPPRRDDDRGRRRSVGAHPPRLHRPLRSGGASGALTRPRRRQRARDAARTATAPRPDPVHSRHPFP